MTREDQSEHRRSGQGFSREQILWASLLVVGSPFLVLGVLLVLPAGVLAFAAWPLFVTGVSLVLGAVTAAGLLGGLPQGKGLGARVLRWLWEGESSTRLEAAREQGKVLFLPSQPGQEEDLSQAHCVFCGGDFEHGPVVRCARCDTPHHQECWSLGGHCAIYGCGETSARRVAWNEAPDGSERPEEDAE